MSDASNVARNLRERFSGTREERLGKALSDVLESPLLTGAIGRAFDARERAAQAQEIAMGALNLPSAADVERLTRRLRSVSQRLEGIEDGVHRLDRTLSTSVLEARLAAIEEQLAALGQKLDARAPALSTQGSASPGAARGAAEAGAKPPGKAKADRAGKAKKRG